MHPITMDEIDIWETEGAIRIKLESQSGDKCLIELSDEIVGYVIERLIYYAWDMTVEEAFGHNTNKKVLDKNF